MFIKNDLKNYVLLQMLALFTLVTFVLFIYLSVNKKEIIDDFANDLISQNSDVVVADVCNIIHSSVDIIDIFCSVLYNVNDNYTDILSKKSLSSIIASQKKIIDCFEGVMSIQAVDSMGNFWQIKNYTEENSISLNKILKQTSNNPIPPNTSYIFRYIDAVDVDNLREEWSYYSEDGNAIMTETKKLSNYTPTQRNWYINATSDPNNLFVSKPYDNNGGMEIPVLTVSSKARNRSFEDGKKCVISADISSKYMQHMLKAKKISRNNMICIVDEKNSLIINSENEDGNSDHYGVVNTHGNEMLTKAIIAYDINNKKSDYFKFTLNNNEYIANFTPLPYDFESLTGKKWKILFIIPEKDVIAKYSKYDSDNNIYFLVMLIAIIQIICIARRLAYPISRLTDEAMRIHKFDFTGDYKTDSKILEIRNLGNAISSLRISLSSFTKYMPKSLVVKLLDKSANVELGGAVKNLAILFSDVENFTSVSEKMTASDLSIHISDYFESLTKILTDQKATIDKYIGDSIMAFWGAPDEDEMRSYNACKSALLCQFRLREFNEKWKKEGKPELNTRIGIHVGDVVVGNVGSSERLNYTILGDAVNLASRLEGANKVYKTKIIVSHSIYEEVKKYFVMLPLDVVSVKGKDESVKVYELIGQIGDNYLDVHPDLLEFVEKFTRAFEFYINMNWNSSLNILENLEIINDYHNVVVDLYKDRCREYIANPPDDNWDSVFRLETK